MRGQDLLLIKVIPGSREDRIVGLVGDALKVRLSAPPERGKANEALICLLASRLGVSRSKVRIVSGHTTHLKRVAVDGMTSGQVLDLLGIS